MKTLLILAAFFVITANTSAQWVQLQNVMTNTTVSAFATNSNVLFAGPGYPQSGVHRSTNGGANWVQFMPPTARVDCFTVHMDYMFAGTDAQGVWWSSNNGINWATAGLSNYVIRSMASNSTTIFAGAYSYGVFRTTNFGSNWQGLGLGGYEIYALAAHFSDVIAGTSNGIYYSSNNGSNWTQVLSNVGWCRGFTKTGNGYFFAGTGLGVWRSSNYGANWEQTNLDNRVVNSMASSGNSVFAGTEFQGFYVSNDLGITWTVRNEGLGNLTIYELCVFNNYILAGPHLNGIWMRQLSQITGIESVSNEIPDGYALTQNYPNPFNPSTTIRFSIPSRSNVKLVVFNAAGEEVAVLVNEVLNAGKYEYNFDGGKLSSGVFYYRLFTDSFTDTRKMVLLK